MKKLTHIAAPVALTALLSACAVPGPEQMMQEASLYLDVQQALENPGPGGLQQAVEKALVNNPGEGNLSEDLQQALDNPGPGGLEQAVEQALEDNPAPGNLSEAVQEAANAAVQQALAQQAAVQQALAQQLASQMTGKEDTLYQELKFEFRNLQKESGRKAFLSALDEIFFVEYKSEGDRTLVRAPKKKGTTKPPYSTVTFTLRDPWGIKSDTKQGIEGAITREAEKAKVVLSGSSAEGIPVSWRSEPKTISFRNEVLSYSTAAAISEGSMNVDKCSMKFKITIKPRPRPDQSPIRVYAYDTEDRQIFEVVGEAFTEDLDGTPIGLDKCEVKPGRKWYVMAHTTDTDDPVAAEYHVATVVRDLTKRGGVNIELDPVKGKVTPEGKPACPPKEWKLDPKEESLFMEKLPPVTEGEKCL